MLKEKPPYKTLNSTIFSVCDIPYYFIYKVHILHIFPSEKLRAILNSMNVNLSNIFLKPTFKNWLCLKFKDLIIQNNMVIFVERLIL
jgi:hypothetical protein